MVSTRRLWFRASRRSFSFTVKTRRGLFLDPHLHLVKSYVCLFLPSRPRPFGDRRTSELVFLFASLLPTITPSLKQKMDHHTLLSPIGQRPLLDGSKHPRLSLRLIISLSLSGSNRSKLTSSLPPFPSVRGLVKHETPSVISLLAGRPNPETFPFASITLHLSPPLGSEPGTNGQDLELNGEDLTQALS